MFQSRQAGSGSLLIVTVLVLASKRGAGNLDFRMIFEWMKYQEKGLNLDQSVVNTNKYKHWFCFPIGDLLHFYHNKVRSPITVTTSLAVPSVSGVGEERSGEERRGLNTKHKIAYSRHQIYFPLPPALTSCGTTPVSLTYLLYCLPCHD